MSVRTLSVMASSRGLGVVLFAESEAAFAGECLAEIFAVVLGADFLAAVFFAAVFPELTGVVFALLLEEVFLVTFVFLVGAEVFFVAGVFRVAAVFLATGFFDFATTFFLVVFFLAVAAPVTPCQGRSGNRLCVGGA